MIVRRNEVQPFDFDGLQITDYTAGLSTSSSLAVIEVRPQVRHKEAWSKRSDKYYCVLAGEVRFAIDGEEYDLAPGDFALIPQGRRFWYENRTSEVAMLILVHTPGFDVEAEVFTEET